eukprot:augustus_masked-scaffold_3-processed-gene-20.39-mRNA-1 protein AED:1.00 eAED:1.00 QI:0/0/0/0/1/1/2/0/430
MRTFSGTSSTNVNALERNKEESVDLKLSAEEEEKFKKAVKKEEFRNLFQEYVDELGDPKFRREQEEMVLQVERDNNMDSGRVTRPKPWFCIKLKALCDKKSNLTPKIFVNACIDENVDKDEKGKIVYLMNGIRFENDSRQVRQYVADFVIHPNIRAKIKTTMSNKNFLTLLEILVEGVNKYMKKWALENVYVKGFSKTKTGGREYKLILMKTMKSFGGLPALLRTAEKNARGQSIKDNTAKTRTKKVLKPKFDIVHSNDTDLSDHFGPKGALSMRPKSLTVRIYLFGVKSAKQISLDLQSSNLFLEANFIDKRLIFEKNKRRTYSLKIDLPFPIVIKKEKAKFDCTSGLLTMSLPVVRNPSQPLELKRREKETKLKEQEPQISPKLIKKGSLTRKKVSFEAPEKISRAESEYKDLLELGRKEYTCLATEA